MQSNCRQHIQVYAVDMLCAVSHIFLKGCKGQQRRVVSAFGKLCHGLGEILISLHHIQVHQVLRGLSAVPFLRFVPIARKQIHTAQQGVHVRQESCKASLLKLLPQGRNRMVRILALAACNLTAGQQASYCKLHIRGASLSDIV